MKLKGRRYDKITQQQIRQAPKIPVGQPVIYGRDPDPAQGRETER